MKKENTSSQPSENPLVNLMRYIELLSIQLVGSDSVIRLPPETVSPDQVTISLKHGFKSGISLFTFEQKQIFCFVSTTLAGALDQTDNRYPQMEKGEVISGNCTFAVRYKFTGTEDPTAETLQALNQTQALFQAYPYIRAYFQHQFSQMGINGIVLPLLNLTKAQKSKEIENK